MLFRIQKLISKEYRDFEETVLVESPFAQINENGFGLRQVQLALTEKNLIIGIDVFDIHQTRNLLNVFCDKQSDPETECMELITVIPLKLISIKIYHEGLRRIMKVVINENKILHFEFGGFIFQNLYYNIWCDRVTMVASHRNIKINEVISSVCSEAEAAFRKQNVEFVDTNLFSNIKDTNESNFLKSLTCCEVSSKIENNFYNKLKPDPKKLLLHEKKLVKTNQNQALKSVAQFLIGTQSDIMLNSSHREIYGENCKHAYYRSASVGDVFPFWNKGW